MLSKDRVKRFLSNRSGVISIVLVLLLAISSLNFFAVANQITVTLEDGNETRQIETNVQTVDAFLKAQNISLGERDSVEPPLDTKLLANTTVTISRAIEVIITVKGESSMRVETNKQTVEEVLAEAGVPLGEFDGCMPGRTSGLLDGIEIIIKRAIPVTLNVFGEERAIMTPVSTVEDLINQQAIVLEGEDYTDPALDAFLYENMNIRAVKVTQSVVKENRAIPFETENRANASMPKGETKVITEGVNGEKAVEEVVWYENGEEVSRTVLNETVLTEPVTKVIEYGTQVAPTSARGLSYSRVIDVVATAYYGGGITASGRPAQVGVIAVDPRVIPMGTRMYIESTDGKYIYGMAVAGDTGGAIKGNKIDLYYNTYQECVNFGRRNCRVYILD